MYAAAHRPQPAGHRPSCAPAGVCLLKQALPPRPMDQHIVLKQQVLRLDKSHSVLLQVGRTVAMEAAAQVLAPSSASLIFLLRSYSVRSLPSKLFLYKYSRRSRAFLRIMLHLAPAVQRSKRRNYLGIVPDRWVFLRRGQTVHTLLGGQPAAGHATGTCTSTYEGPRQQITGVCILLASMANKSFLGV